MNTITRLRIDKEIEDFKNTMNQSDLTDTPAHCNQQQQNVHLSPVRMEQSPG